MESLERVFAADSWDFEATRSVLYGLLRKEAMSTTIREEPGVSIAHSSNPLGLTGFIDVWLTRTVNFLTYRNCFNGSHADGVHEHDDSRWFYVPVLSVWNQFAAEQEADNLHSHFEEMDLG